MILLHPRTLCGLRVVLIAGWVESSGYFRFFLRGELAVPGAILD